MPKSVWRAVDTLRTFTPSNIFPFVASAWKTSNDQDSPFLIESDMDVSHRPRKTAVRKANKIKYSGVFRLQIDDRLKVHLDTQACKRELHAPERLSRHLATLRPWHTLRVLLNGNADWHSESYFFVREYHVLSSRLPLAQSCSCVVGNSESVS